VEKLFLDSARGKENQMFGNGGNKSKLCPRRN
jgi:hypothetical protein